MKSKNANLLSFFIFVLLCLFFIEGRLDAYDFVNLSSGVFIFSAFSFSISKVIYSYQKIKEEKEKLLEKMAHTDELTGAYNRRKFFENVKNTKGTNGLLMIDLDRFKKINDTYGHNMGDEVLKSFAETVRKNIRKEDFFARIGGEEFVVILNNLDKKGTITVAEKLRKKIENINVNGIKFTVSIGATLFKEGDEIYKVLTKADKALYEAKKERNKVVFID
jgi:diguanylate cyclase (GGDEF)-like protein